MDGEILTRAQRISFWVNKRPVSTEVKVHETLLELLRRLGFVEVKASCGRGECGNCAVVLDGTAVNSCMVLAVTCDEKEIRTSKAEDLVELQHSLVREGAIQCGFCTPGFVNALAPALGDAREPEISDLEKKLDGHLCRCSGYVNQRRALEKLLEERSSPGLCSKQRSSSDGAVGQRVEKRDSLAMAQGKALYCDDELPPRPLYLHPVHSPKTHARVLEMNCEAALEMPGVADVITPFNLSEISIPLRGPSLPEEMIDDNHLLSARPRYGGDRVAAIVAVDAETARKAEKLLKIEYEELPAVLGPEEAMGEAAPRIHPDGNVVASLEYSKASEDLPEQEDSDDPLVSLKMEVNLAPVRPAFAEPFSCVTRVDSRGNLIVRSSTQVPFFVRWSVSRICGFPLSRIRVIKPAVGGGFGAKQEAIVEPLCALATLRTGRPVRFVLDRQQVFRLGRHRHPAKISLFASRRHWKLDTLKMDVTLDKGAYRPHARAVLLCSASRALPLYKWRNLEFKGRSVLTNKPSSGGLRGYGSPQSFFALETAIDELAVQGGLDPLELRLKNMVCQGSSLEMINDLAACDDVVPKELAGDWGRQCLQRGAELFQWKSRREDLSSRSPSRFRRGVGLACAMQAPSSLTLMRSAATVQMNEDGTFTVVSGAADIGTGAETILAQMAAEVLAVPMDWVIVKAGDTEAILYDSGAYASSTTWNAGAAVTEAATQARGQVLELAERISGEPRHDLYLAAARVCSRKSDFSMSLSDLAVEAITRPDCAQVSATVSKNPKRVPPSFNAQFVELEVDCSTGYVKLCRVLSVVDCGKPINPSLVEAQMHGAVGMGLGAALTEELKFNSKGIAVNANYSTYQIPRMIDMPEIEVEIVETCASGLPFGAKSVGEIGCMPTMAAVGNALAHATGQRYTRLPFTPWRVMNGLEVAREGE